MTMISTASQSVTRPAAPASNADRIRGVYAAFSRGDVPAILEVLAEDVDWEYGRPAPSEVPWLRSGRGRAHAAAFFQSLQALEFERFEVKEILEAPGLVVALVDLQFVVRANGRRLTESDEIHVWRFDDQGRCVRFRHGVDTAAHERAWRG